MADETSGVGGGGAAGSAIATGGLAGAVLAFEELSARAASKQVREAGEQVADETSSLVGALDAAAVAAAGVAGGLVCGPALAACADLLARRSRDLRDEAARCADGMERALDVLRDADGEVARRVAGTTG